VLSVPEAATAIDREVQASLRILEAPTTSWDTPTRLTDWSVADLAFHLAFGQALQADAWRRIRAGDTDAVSAEPGIDPSSGRTEVLAAYRAAAAELQSHLSAVSEADLGNVATMPYGPVPGAVVLQVAVMEAGAHASDLAAAVGRSDELADDVVAASFVVLRGFLPVLGQLGAGSAGPEDVDAVRLESPTHALSLRRSDEGWTADDEAAPTVVRGSASELVLFALGRRPGGSAALSVEGSSSILERFKVLFPGP
jgi:uncharacterized protein (TIGR03083 family)